MSRVLSEGEAQKLKVAGAIIIGISLVVLYGIVGATESDCYYFWQLIGQYRYCDEAHAGKERAINYTHLIGTFSVLGLGIVLHRKGAKVIQFHKRREKDEVQAKQQ
jgi:hypothetical protein